MKFYIIFQRTALIIAVEKENLEIIDLLLQDQNIDTNSKFILDHLFLISLEYKIFLLH